MTKQQKNTRKPILSDAQSIAIDALVSGSTQLAAAAAAGVDRHTLAKWQREEPLFIAAWNAQRYAIQSENAERLRRMGASAIDVMERALESKDESIALKAAQTLFKTLGLETVTPIAVNDLDPEVIQAEIKHLEMKKLLLKMRGMEPPSES